MNDKLSVLYKQLSRSGVPYSSACVDDDMMEAVERECLMHLDGSHQFYFGDGEDYLGIDAAIKIGTIPYSSVFSVFEGLNTNGERVVSGVLLYRVNTNEHGTYRNWIIRNGLDLSYSVFRWDNNDNEWQFFDSGILRSNGSAIQSFTRFNGIPDVGFALRGFNALRCENVEKIEHPPSRLRLARAKKQGQKAFSVWTLHIKRKSRRACHEQEGTHASPRLHLRRGHVREFAPGRFTWVRECLVGDVRRGAVAKDYRVSV